ncbi:MAG: hypothetical protein HY710_08260, partial [Candidatus Latescibacteria bacterium]|nr:hypothetical protein [Candidatus Latescibacterota bacterium]
RLFSGSWIGHSFATWIGHPEKNAGWECLDAARHALIEHDRAAVRPEDHRRLQDAWESLFIAEGSDWFWWYGDDHSSLNDEEFDALFRTHVANVYRSIGASVPERLLRPIRQPRVIQPTRLPMGPISPSLDGRATSYYEWLPAGYYDVRGGRGSMHQAETFLKRVHYGFDAERMYLRVDTAAPLADEACQTLQLQFLRPVSHRLVIGRLPDGQFTLSTDGDDSALSGVTWAVGRVVELAIPLAALHARPAETIQVELAVYQDESEVERWPRAGVVQFTVPDADEAASWVV